MTSSRFVPADQAQRDRIRDALDETLFVEAGAGTGKTTSLVERVAGLVSKGVTTLDRIAAITFTEAAASELSDRVREVLEKAANDPALSPSERQRCRQGVDDLDQASIQTLHSFAADLLHARPFEAGLPPGFQVMDSVEAEIAFEAEWGRWLDSALDDPDLNDPLSLALSLGMSLGHLRGVAEAFHKEYDRLEGVVFGDPAPLTGAAAASLVSASSVLERLCDFANNGEEDKLAIHVRAVLGTTRRLGEIDFASPQAYRLLHRGGPIRTNSGAQRDWSVDPASGVNACKVLKDKLKELHEQVQAELGVARQAALSPLLTALCAFASGYANRRKTDGVAEFHDLLVWARDLLRDNLEVRDHFRDRFTHLLVDEAQDTDLLQAEIAVFLAEDASNNDETGPRPNVWTDVALTPGKLFVVGDPKQSIYRFRRADIGQMKDLQGLMGVDPVRLVQNFRSQQPVMEWVNELFAEWMAPQEGQAEYVSVVHRWQAETTDANAPRVWRLGDITDDRTVGPLRRREAGAMSELLRGVVSESWQVLDREATERDGVERYRPARFSDICILMPRRTALRALELALDRADVPYRLEGVSLVFDTQEVRDLLNCLRAIDDPADKVALVAALRSPAFACSDEDLLRFHQQQGAFDYLDPGGTSDGPVVEALQVLNDYNSEWRWGSIASLIDRFVRDRRLIELALGDRRPRERLRRYRFLVDRARAYTQAGGASLRGFLKWADRQLDEGARVTESPVPEADEDAVRVMTVHGAKGLEFPIVVLTGLNSNRRRQSQAVLIDRETGAVEVGVGTQRQRFATAGHESLAERETQMQAHEDVRLLYVAATRARDHLVLSMFRTARNKDSPAAQIDELLDGHDDLWMPVRAFAGADVTSSADPPRSELAGEPTTLDAREMWKVKRKRLLDERSRPRSVAGTALGRVEKEDAGVEEPWRRGRGGTSLGRAVHAVLQTIDLATGTGLDETAKAQATAEGIPHQLADVVRLSRYALESDIVRRAVASGRYWREAPVASPVGDGVVEGFIDLLFEEDGELVVVDYKTDSLYQDQAAGAAKRYRLQGGAYALALQRATGMKVREIVFLFLEPRRPESLSGIDELLSETEAAALEHMHR
ncbi:MAG: UvrD-helicase domain-containing protein [SAR202 cluster bacterium]|nr:UvrD-helicase domain-containing protein [SAR202 cluster bacterium]MDP6663506.1 UvrD-helicase domain-containing protein [SAR202 cluster bacterium]MDP6800983.1 UvrD-helicase domain-containing protein [SAR202 cluster bacterium]